MARVFVGVGSNIEPARHLPLAVQALTQRFGALQRSAVYASAPVGLDGPDFFNMVVGFVTEESAQVVARVLKEIERGHGQTPRVLDLDFLLYGDLVIDRPGLTLPRADICRYAFVLRPLAEIAPEQRHPSTGERYADLWASFSADDQALRPVELELP